MISITRGTRASALLAATLLSASSHAATLRVPQDFSTIQAAINAMRPGDVIAVAAGTYDGPFDLNDVACSPTARCTIRGAGRDLTVLRGMRPATDWQSAGTGVYRRTMPAVVDGVATHDLYPMRDAYDPGNVYQTGVGTEFPGESVPLGYAGDNVVAPGNGRWSYHPATRQIYVDPYGAAAPGTLMIPFVSRLVDVQRSAGNWTFEDLNLDGARAFIMDHRPVDPRQFANVHLRRVGSGYVGRAWVWLNQFPGGRLEDVRLRYLGRGISPIAPSDQRSAFGLRVFAAHGLSVSRLDCRHVGSGAGPCPNCEAPWNNVTFSTLTAGGHCVDIKQTNGCVVEDSIFDDGPVQGAVEFDSSHDCVIRRSLFSRNGTAMLLSDSVAYSAFPATYGIFAAENVYQSNQTDIRITTGRLSGQTTLTMWRQVRLDGALRVSSSPLPAGVVVLADGAITSSTSTSTSSTTRPPASSSSSTTTTRPTTTSTRASTTSTRPPTTSSSSTTTSTLPVFSRQLSGQTVHFLDDPFDPARQVLYVRSEDVTQLVPGDGVNVTRLLAQGGIVHVREIGGDGINAWYVLPPSGWHLIDDANPRAGIRYRNPYGAITSLDFATNDYLRIIGQGRQLIQSLAIEP